MPVRENSREEVTVFEPPVFKMEDVRFRDGGGEGQEDGRVVGGSFRE
jgi:hypothetical protein